MSALAAGSISLDGVVTNLTTADANKHEYKVYQIFTGDLVEINGEKQLQNVKYGANYGDTGASVPKTVLDTITNAKDFAKTAEAAVKGDPIVTLSSKNNFASGDLPEGYYLVVDDTAKTLTDGDAYSNYIIQVLDTVADLKVKKEVPTGDKVIDNDSLGADTTSDNTALAGENTAEIDDVSIGDKVNFKATGTVPTTATDYDYYFFIMNDTLSEGLTLDAQSFVVTSNKDGKATLVKDVDYAVYPVTETFPNSFKVALIDAIAFAGKTITVAYDATLNENAKMFDEANPNTFSITYSNNPKHEYDGDKDNGKPGLPDSNKDVPTGKTPDETTETFTTGIKIKKVDQDGLSLAGATFTIEGDSVEKIVHYNEAFEQATGDDAKYWKLTNGTYTDQAPQTADEYIAAPAGATNGYVSDGNGGYRVVNQGETPTHILKKKNSELYDSTTTKYKKTSTKAVEDSTSHKSETMQVEADGTLTFNGLGAGTYTIKEIQAPKGYTKIARDLTVTITFNPAPATGESHWTATGDAEKDTEGYFTVTVENVAGNVLPTTGGMGTTILYIGGSILVLAAAILLITKRRMNAQD